MKARTTFCLAIAIVITALVVSDALARGGRGGGGRGGGGAAMSRGGGGRPSPSINRSPSMSRPSTPSRPSHGASRPSPSRPSSPNISRPGGGQGGQRPSTRPQQPSRPQQPVRPQQPSRPQQPGQGARPGQGRPGGGSLGQGHPSPSQLQQFMNLPSQGAGRPNLGSGAARPSQRPAGQRPGAMPEGGNRAVADFLQSSPAQGRDRDAIASNRSDRMADRGEARPNVSDQRADRRDNVSDNRQDRAQNRGDRQTGRVDDRSERRSNLADGREDRRTDRQQQLGDRADNIRDRLDNHYNDRLFDDFWYNHPRARYRFNQNPIFWTWATVRTIQAFMPWNWGTTAYYDYGSGGNVYYEGDTVYVYGEEYPAEEYAAQAEEIVQSAPVVENTDDMEWLPLGVFALTKDGDSGAVPNMFLQLALSKEGIIAGTYQNKTTGETESVEGMVDEESQRAAWTIAGKNTPIMETGIMNLTQNETKVLVHFADGTTQEWLMLHIENPEVGDQ